MKQLLATVLFLFSLSAQSLVHIEPYVGYSFLGAGKSEVGDRKYDHSFSSLTLGGRAGVRLLGFSIGADYSIQNSILRSEFRHPDGVFADPEDKAKKQQLGIFVGYSLPGPLRFWGTYFISGSLEGKDPVDARYTQGITKGTEFKDGSGFGAGVGIQFLFISLNLEFRKIKYDSLVYENQSANSQYKKKLDFAEFLVSGSLVF